ncbi:MAG: CHAT domain-containing protein [bacterium]|nr:MAG: CHAT domain-containing protein [bacterium]
MFQRVIILLFVLLISVSSVEARDCQALLDLADSLSLAYEPDSAFAVGLQALECAVETHGDTHAFTGRVLYFLGIFTYEMGDYHGAVSLYDSALVIQRVVHPPDNIAIGMTVYNRANAYLDLGMLKEAEKDFEGTLEIFKENFGDTNFHVGHVLKSLASLNRDLGRYPESERLFKEASEVYVTDLGIDDPNVANCLDGCALLYKILGRFYKAESLFREALAIREKHLDPRDLALILNYDHLASLYWKQGRYAEAELLFKKALTLIDPDHPHVSTIACNLAVLYNDMGRFAEAESLYILTRTVEMEVWGDENPEVAVTLGNFAGLYLDMGRFAEAESLCKLALEIRKKTLPPDHPYIAVNLGNLADIKQIRGNLHGAEPLYKRSIALYRKTVGDEHPDLASTVHSYASLLRDKGSYDEAEPKYDEAVSIWRKVYGPIHPDIALGYEHLGILYRLQRRRDESADVSRRAFDIRWNDFQKNGYVLTEKDALSYSLKLRASAENALSCYFGAKPDDSQLFGPTYDMVLAAKGPVSDIIFERQRALVSEEDTEISRLADSLKTCKYLLAALFYSTPEEESVGKYRHRLDSLRSVVDDIESGLSLRSASYRESQQRERITGKDIASLLPANAVLVEYFRYNFYRTGPRDLVPRYMVTVLDSKGPRMIDDIGDAKAIDELVTRYQKHMLDVSKSGGEAGERWRSKYTTLARQLYRSVFAPIAGYVRNKELVFIAPDGPLGFISFAGLIDEDGRYLIESVPIHYLSAGRDLVRFQGERESNEGLFALGNPDFNASGSERLKHISSSEEAERSRTRSVRLTLEDRHSLHAEQLEHSEPEVNRVIEYWRSVNDEPVIRCTGKKASEENFKLLAPGNRVIHLSTHGYFAARRQEPPAVTLYMQYRTYIGENPLLLSGFCLAGSNVRGETRGSVAVEDGILTAYEVASMNLEGTDLVVLSACETGLGETRLGEGGYGLRRAFQLAGARAVVSALWEVSDKVTAEMIPQLYRRSGESLTDRAHAMQLDQIKKLREEGRSDHPYYWAAFITEGDWR